jgi:hypothetical protein
LCWRTKAFLGQNAVPRFERTAALFKDDDALLGSFGCNPAMGRRAFLSLQPKAQGVEEFMEHRYFYEKDVAGCGVLGMISERGDRFSGQGIVEGMATMNDRGNGLGAGFQPT